MKAKLISILLFGFILFFVRCQHKPTEEIIPAQLNTGTGGPGNYPVIPPRDTLCFSSDILPIVVSNCAKPGCHTTLNSYGSIMQIVTPKNINASRLYTQVRTPVKTSGNMPQGGQMDTASMNKIIKWINQGAINSVCNSCDTVNVKFSTHVWPLIQQNCLGCHVSNTTMLNNYTQVKAQATNGQLFCAINQNGGCNPMPQNGGKLSACKIRMVKI
ncbi:MAG: hypothetical protein ACHQK8_08555, partial [Bacteroidia bacterium]